MPVKKVCVITGGTSGIMLKILLFHACGDKPT